MRALTWVSAGMLTVASASCLFAQDSIQAERVQVPPLSIHLLSSDGSYLQYQLSDPAYIAAFEVYSGGAAELLYPYASSDYPEAVGMHVHALSYLTEESEERATLLASYPLQSNWACLFVVASRQPLQLDGFATHPLALAKSIGYHSVSLTNPQAALAPILNSARPANPHDWATDELCGPIHQSFAAAGPTLGEFAEEPFIPVEDEIPEGVAEAGYGSVIAVGASTPGVCERASVACKPKKLPFKPLLDAPDKDRPVVLKPEAIDKAGAPALRIGTRENRPPSGYVDPKLRATTAQAGVATGGGFDHGSAATYSTTGSGSSPTNVSSSNSRGASSTNAAPSGGNRSAQSSGGNTRSGGSSGGSSSSSNSGASSGRSSGGSSSGGGYTGGGGYSGGGSFGGGGVSSGGGATGGDRH